MPKFRRIPTETEAEQYTGEGAVKGICDERNCFCADFVHVHTIHNRQVVRLEKGDWVLPEPDGVHYYPVKDEVFRVSYEEVKEDIWCCISFAGDSDDNTFRSLFGHHPNCPRLRDVPISGKKEFRECMERIYDFWKRNTIEKIVAEAMTYPVGLEAAVNRLRYALADDSDLYYAYQSNIAMAFVDAWRWEGDETQTEVLHKTASEMVNFHSIANRAAKHFLDLLIGDCKTPSTTEVE